MLKRLFHKLKHYALLKKGAIVTLLLIGIMATPSALALQKFPNITDRVAFENATDKGRLFESGHYVVRHREDETQIGFTITNTSDEIIDAPYRLVLKHFFSFRRVNIEGVDGYTRRGDPYILLNQQLAPGETTAPIEMTITWPDKNKKRGWWRRWTCKHFGTLVFFKLRAQRVIETLYDSKTDFTANVLEVLDPSVDLFSDIDHTVNNRLVDVAHAIHLLAVLNREHDPDLSRLMLYLRAYGSNGPYDLSPEQADILNTALRAVADMRRFRSLSPSAAEIIESYAYALRNFYNRDNMIPHLHRNLDNMVKLFAFYQDVGDVYHHEGLGEALFETIKTYAYLYFYGKSNASLADVLLANTSILPAVTELAADGDAIIPPDLHPVLGERYNTWVLDWLMWGYAQHWTVASGDAVLADSVDDAVRAVVDAHADEGVFHEVLKAVMYRAFLGNTRSASKGELCNNEFAAQCLTDRSDNPEVFTANVLELLNPATNYYSFDFAHTAPNRLQDVLAALDFLAQSDELADPAIQRLLNYLDSYSYYTNGDFTVDSALALQQTYLNVASMSDFLSTREPAGKVLSEYVYGLRNMYDKPAMVGHLAELMPTLLGIIEFFVADDNHRSHPGFNDAAFELVRSFAFLAYDAYFDATLRAAVMTPEVLDALQAMASDDQVIFPSDNDTLTLDWFLWGMSNYWWDAWGIGDNAGMLDMDNRVRAIVSTHADHPMFEIIKSIVLRAYVQNTSRGLDVCNTEFAGVCGELDISNIFVDSIDCPTINVKIFAQDMTDPQLNDSCDSMAAQEVEFHSTMGTSRETPVADDFNDFLNVFIFGDSDQYRALGTALFNISTDNGGIYIEGDPSNPDTQATFYAHEAQWLRPEFVVWNLDHEFVHYLDGRYIQYGAFSHFPQEQTVWWQEGLAEFFAQGADNDRALRLLTTISEENWPTLAQITHITYEASSDMVYGWSYWVHRFMHANHLADVLSLAELLKSGTPDDLLAYQTTVNDWGVMYQDEFVQYLRDQRDLEASLSTLFAGQAGSGGANAAGAAALRDAGAPDQRDGLPRQPINEVKNDGAPTSRTINR